MNTSIRFATETAERNTSKQVSAKQTALWNVYKYSRIIIVIIIIIIIFFFFFFRQNEFGETESESESKVF